MDCSPPGSSVHGILQARILEWLAMPFSRGSFCARDRTHVSYVSCTGRRGSLLLVCPGKPRITERKKKVKSHSRVRFFATPWTVAHQAPPSLGFSRQEYWSGLPFPSPRDLPDPAIKPRSPELQADALPPEPPGKLYLMSYVQIP